MSDTSEVERVLDCLRGAMQVDGGDVELVSVEDNVVSVRLLGMCLHCPSASLTIKFGIEQNLRKELPWITEVVRVF